MNIIKIKHLCFLSHGLNRNPINQISILTIILLIFYLNFLVHKNVIAIIFWFYFLCESYFTSTIYTKNLRKTSFGSNNISFYQLKYFYFWKLLTRIVQLRFKKILFLNTHSYEFVGNYINQLQSLKTIKKNKT